MELKDGFYLSVYSCIDKYLNYFKYSLRHDHNMSLWKKDGRQISLVHHWEFERITGYKHHNISFYNVQHAKEFINRLLSQYDISLDDIQYIFGTPLISTTEEYYTKDIENKYTYHAISHLFSSVMLDSKVFYEDSILALVVDAGADALIDNPSFEKFDFLGAYIHKGTINYFSIPSPGKYWRLLSTITKLEEGTLMALATATTCRTLETIIDKTEIIEIYNIYKHKADSVIKKIYNHICQYKRTDEETKFTGYDSRFTEDENKISMIAKIIQEISINQIDKIIDNAILKYNIKPNQCCISLSGGYALNCPTNVHIMQKYKFKKQLIPPCANDGGQALGMGLYFFYQHMHTYDFCLQNAYYGDNDDSIDENLKKFNIFIESVDNTMDYFVRDLQDKPIVWFNDRSEIGPRALGNRSILASPLNLESKSLLNLYKQRQWWRPVSPIIISTELDNWYVNAFQSPFMLNNFTLKNEYINIVPSIIHLDNTARVQTIDRETNSLLFDGILDFFHETGIPMLCNTSLNDKGEPIINTIQEAFNFALRKKINILYINGVRIHLKNFDLYSKQEPEKRGQAEFVKNVHETIPYTLIEYLTYKVNPKLNSKYKINSHSDYKELKPILSRLARPGPN